MSRLDMEMPAADAPTRDHYGWLVRRMRLACEEALTELDALGDRELGERVREMSMALTEFLQALIFLATRPK